MITLFGDLFSKISIPSNGISLSKVVTVRTSLYRECPSLNSVFFWTALLSEELASVFRRILVTRDKRKIVTGLATPTVR